MNTEKRILFGVDDSEFALQALTAVGGLLKNSKDYGITLFYGSPKNYNTWKKFAAWKRPMFWSKPKKP
jgi:hypothetical protein